MKSIREKNYTKERRKEFAKVFSLVFMFITAILLFTIWGVSSVHKANEQSRIADSIAAADSIARMDSIAAADTISIKNDTIVVDTVKTNTTAASDTVTMSLSDTSKVVIRKPGVYKATVNGEKIKIVIKA